ncbi:MAG: hypothetical protein PHX61_10940 [Alphaproteobacteria bacterium]|nr:hypothetical protein [Alphaproteobacteria bacterium]
MGRAEMQAIDGDGGPSYSPVKPTLTLLIGQREASHVGVKAISTPMAMKDHPVLAMSARLRHDIFCIKKKWEKVRPDGMETDSYDPVSHHFSLLASLKGESSEKVLAYLRLVDGSLPRKAPDNQNAQNLIPMQAAGVTLSDQVLRQVERGESLEISRLCASDVFGNKMKTGSGAVLKPSDLNLLMAWDNCHRTMPQVKSFVAILEPELCRQFERHGLKVKQIAPEVDHRGVRVPIEIDILDPRNIVVTALLKDHFRRALGKSLKPLHHVTWGAADPVASTGANLYWLVNQR